MYCTLHFVSYTILLLLDDGFNLYGTSEAESELLLGKWQVCRAGEILCEKEQSIIHGREHMQLEMLNYLKAVCMSSGWHKAEVSASGGAFLRGRAQCVNT
jgi:hypothetical protein